MNNVVLEKPNLVWYDYVKSLVPMVDPFWVICTPKAQSFYEGEKRAPGKKRMFTNLLTQSSNRPYQK